MFLLYDEKVDLLFEQADILKDEIMLQNNGTRGFKKFAATSKQTKKM